MNTKKGSALPYNVDIRSSDNGRIIVCIGCKTFVFGDSKEERTAAAQDLAEYLISPETAMAEFYGEEQQPEEAPRAADPPRINSVRTARGV